MSNFEVSGDGLGDDGQPKDGFDDKVRRVIEEYLADPIRFTQVFKTWVAEWPFLNGVDIPLSQIVGFSQNQALHDQVTTSETTTSTTYDDLATDGPELAGLGPGQYLILFGAFGNNSAASHRMSLQVNATEASDADSILWGTASNSAAVRAITKTLTASTNTLTAKYKTTSDTATYQDRWLVALRFANA